MTFGLKKKKLFRPGQEAEDRGHWPRQDPSLAARKTRENFAPEDEPALERSVAVEKVEETLRESPGGLGGTDRVSEGHFFEGKKKMRPGLDPDRAGGRLGVTALFEELSKLSGPQRLLERVVRRHLVVALPVEVWSRSRNPSGKIRRNLRRARNNPRGSRDARALAFELGTARATSTRNSRARIVPIRPSRRNPAGVPPCPVLDFEPADGRPRPRAA